MRLNAAHIQTTRLKLVPNTLEDVRALIEAMDADQKAQLSAIWLALVNTATVDDPWTLGFTLLDRASDAVIGTCGFKGPPDLDGIVEIAYGVDPQQQGKGYATEAAEALVAYAFASGQVRVVRAHTMSDTNASARVLAKCDFRRIGQVVDPEDGPVWRWERSAP